MVRIAGLTGQAAAGVTVRSPDGRLRRSRRSPRRAPASLELYAEQARIWADELCPALAAEGIVVVGRRRPRAPPSGRSSSAATSDEIFPVLTPLAVGPGPAVPVHLRPLGEPRRLRARPGDRRGALRAREGAGGPAALPRPSADAGRLVPLEQVLTHFLPSLFPGHGDRRALALPRHARRRPRGLRRGRRPARGGRGRAPPAPLRRGDAPRGVARRCRTRCARGCSRVCASPTTSSTRSTGMIDLADVDELTKLDRPDLKVDPWVPLARPPLANARRRGAVRARSAPATSSSITRTTRSRRASSRSRTRARTTRTSSRSSRRCTGRATSRRSCRR